MPKLALIGTFYGRHEQSVACVKRVLESTRVPDEIFLLCETPEDAINLQRFIKDPRVQLHVLSTPKNEDGTYAVIPYSYKINFALEYTTADYICYLDNGSMPHKEKYGRMERELRKHADGAVYCTQERTGYAPGVHRANDVVVNPHSVINYTQAMHRKTDKRWTLDMKHASPDIADALFFQSLGVPFYPVSGEKILDTHHMESATASGL